MASTQNPTPIFDPQMGQLEVLEQGIAMFHGFANVAFGLEFTTLIGSNSLIAPAAPDSATVGGPPSPETLLGNVSIPVSKPATAGLKVTPAVQAAGAVSVTPEQASVAIVKSGLSRATVPGVTLPLPVALKVTDSTALVEPMLGTPNVSLVGDTVKVGDCASAGCATAPTAPHISTNDAMTRSFIPDAFMAASLRRVT